MSCCPTDDNDPDQADSVPFFEHPDKQGRGNVRDLGTREKIGEYQLPSGPDGQPMVPFQSYPGRLLVEMEDPRAPDVGDPIDVQVVPSGQIYLSPPDTQTVFHTTAQEGEHFEFR